MKTTNPGLRLSINVRSMELLLLLYIEDKIMNSFEAWLLMDGLIFGWDYIVMMMVGFDLLKHSSDQFVGRFLSYVHKKEPR